MKRYILRYLVSGKYPVVTHYKDLTDVRYVKEYQKTKHYKLKFQAEQEADRLAKPGDPIEIIEIYI